MICLLIWKGGLYFFDAFWKLEHFAVYFTKQHKSPTKSQSDI